MGKPDRQEDHDSQNRVQDKTQDGIAAKEQDRKEGKERKDRQNRKVEVSILNQMYTFVGEDEGQIHRAAEFCDARIKDVVKNYGIVNTLNAIMMAMMSIAAEYLETKERVERVEDRTLKLLKKVEEFDVPCGVRDRWQT